MIAMPLEESEKLDNNADVLKRILWLRVSMLLIACLALIGYKYALERELQYGLLFGIVFGGVAYSLATFYRLRVQVPIRKRELVLHLAIDALILITMVAFSGRATNPFIYYLLVLVAISATIFDRRVSWLFTLAAIVAYSALLYFDLEGHMHHMFSDFQLHLVGMWINFVGSAILIDLFVSRLSTALRNQQEKLAAAREENLKNEQLIGIGTLAASTAHALGTPLSTMAVLASELHNNDDTEEIKESSQLLLGQIDRCKETLNKLSLLASQQDAQGGELMVVNLLAEIEEHYQIMIPRISPSFSFDGLSEECTLEKNLLLKSALINLLDNAIRAANKTVSLSAKLAGSDLLIDILNDGKGLNSEVIKNWGKPGFNSESGGLGIGVFLANSTIEKMKGEINIIDANITATSMTHIQIRLPVHES